MKRTPEQNRMIWALAGEIGLDEGLLRDLVERLTKQRSTSALTSAQARVLIDEMNRLGGKQSSSKAQRPGMASPEQIYKIKQLEGELGWTDNPKRLQAFMSKYSKGIVRLEWLKATQANKLIESLKGMKNSLERKQQV